MLTALILLLVVVQQSIANKGLLKCSSTYPNIKLDCAKPYLQKLVSSIEQCQQFCIESVALSCQYDTSRKLCELFDVKAEIGSEGTVTSSYNHRSADQPETVQNTAKTHARQKYRVEKSNCEPSPIPSIGTTLITIDSNCVLDKTASQTARNVVIGNGKKLIKIWKPANMHYSGAKIASAITPASLANIHGLSSNLTEFSTIHSRSGKGDNFKDSDCLSGFALRFEIIQGIEILANALVSFASESSDSCLNSCQANHVCVIIRTANGSSESVSCRSAQYSRLERRCSFFDNSISPTGNAPYEPNSDMIYFEKICLPESLTKNCYDALRRVPQYVLVGHATAVVDAQTQSFCIELCMRSVDDYGFECRSAIYFYEYPGLNCILNAESARTRPKFFAAELEQKVDYIEMSDCQQTMKQEDPELSNCGPMYPPNAVDIRKLRFENNVAVRIGCF
uniref:Apple domain-containing protein n=1 Tax=Syphacia muris TaxID=451379 RepID=A0A0N5AQE8_9BILA